MVADLRRCVGCQTCTAACKHANATSPAVQWRRVLDLEVGSYPQVARVFVPVGCMHCADPPCMHVCPSTATGQRPDGIVTIDYDLCIGCSYCAVACPYQARFKVDAPSSAYGAGRRMKHEAAREEAARIGVAQKCTFCSDRIDYGLENGLTPGIDAEATPACVNSCIAEALHFGNLDDPASNISTLLADHKSFRMHEEVATDSGFHYIWAEGSDADADDYEAVPAAPSRGVGNIGGAAPWLQQHWDWRAAGNFICGGSGAGLMAAAAIAALLGGPAVWLAVPALGFIGFGLFLVWLETGRPKRAPLNVFFNARTSWMTREAMVAMVLFPVTASAIWLGLPVLWGAAGLLALGFLYCQARMLKAARGIPAWRQPEILPFIVSTGLAEGAGLGVALMVLFGVLMPGLAGPALGLALLGLIAARAWAYGFYLLALNRGGAPAMTLVVLARLGPVMTLGGHVLAAALILAGLVFGPAGPALLAAAGLLIAFGGWWMKGVLITRAAYNQGFAINRSPQRGGKPGPGAKPGWNRAA